MEVSLEYNQAGRGGNICCRVGCASFKLDWEFAGGNGVMIIFHSQSWTALTGLPLKEKEMVLSRIAEMVIRDKAPGCIFEIYDQYTEIRQY